MSLVLRQPRRPLSDESDTRSRAPDDSSASLLSTAVARISDDELQKMSRDDLIDVIRIATASLPQQEFSSHLRHMGRDQLHQLVCLARHSCQLRSGLIRDCG